MLIWCPSCWCWWSYWCTVACTNTLYTRFLWTAETITLCLFTFLYYAKLEWTGVDSLDMTFRSNNFKITLNTYANRIISYKWSICIILPSRVLPVAFSQENMDFFITRDSLLSTDCSQLPKKSSLVRQIGMKRENENLCLENRIFIEYYIFRK